MPTMPLINTILTGAAFGAALTASGVYQPSVIVSQLKLQNWHMIQTFLTAAATSAYVFTHPRPPPRFPLVILTDLIIKTAA